MKRLIAIFVLIIGTAGAATFDQVNQYPDCKIAFIDFALFADDWLKTGIGLASDFDGSGTVDIYDLDIFADYWLSGSETIAPVVQGEFFTLPKNTSYIFNINAASDLPLVYTVESLPSKGTVYDSANILIISVPYILPDTAIKYTAGDYNDTADGFTFAANDNSQWSPPCGGKVIAPAYINLLNLPPAKATNPNPDINSINIAIDSNLTWSAGAGSSSHLVYFGTVTPPGLQVEQDGNLYDPNNLAYGANYYWRIDEQNPNGVTTGDTWKFTTVTRPIPPSSPVASDVSASAYTYVTSSINLTATDDGEPNPPGRIEYIITSLPGNATLQDPCAGSSIIDVNMLPYTLSFNGSTVWFAADTNVTRVFQYNANDGNVPDGNGNTATVTVTVLDHPRDILSFDGQGIVEFNDNNYYDAGDGWAIDFWVRTREPFTGLFKKRDANQGWEIGLVSGKPKIYIYDSNAILVAEARSSWRIDNGQWHEICFNFNQDSNGIYLVIQISGGNFEWGSWEDFSFAGDSSSVQNDCNLILGLNSKQGYRGDVDMLRFFTGITDPDGIAYIIQGFNTRDGTGDSFETWGGFGIASKVRYPMSEGSGSIITDDKLGLTGILRDPNHVRWQPFYWPFEDVSVQQSYRRNK
jgi:hypothetical protein